jgi:REP element-mobilizing transposase RayT
MGRQRRVLYAGAHYHVMARGNRRAAVFLVDDDCRLFLSLLAETCLVHHWRCLSYCLMGNHYHLVLCTQRATLSAGMHYLNGLYARAFNAIHDTTGHVFESRFYPKVIEDDRYLATVIRYVESNPVRARLCATALDWRWSSYSAVIGLRSHRAWFDRMRVLAMFGTDVDTSIERYIAFVGEKLEPDLPWDEGAGKRRQRDRAILEAHRAGLPVVAIASRLGTSPRTVRRVIGLSA